MNQYAEAYWLKAQRNAALYPRADQAFEVGASVRNKIRADEP